MRLDVGKDRIQELLNDRQVFEDASLVAYGYDLLRRENGIANGPAVLALWRRLRMERIRITQARISTRSEWHLDAENRLLALLRNFGQNAIARRTWPNNAMNASRNRPAGSLRSATSTPAALSQTLCDEGRCMATFRDFAELTATAGRLSLLNPRFELSQNVFAISSL